MITVKADGDHVIAAEHGMYDSMIGKPISFVRVPDLVPFDIHSMDRFELSQRARSAISEPVKKIGDAPGTLQMTDIGGR